VRSGKTRLFNTWDEGRKRREIGFRPPALRKSSSSHIAKGEETLEGGGKNLLPRKEGEKDDLIFQSLSKKGL